MNIKKRTSILTIVTAIMIVFIASVSLAHAGSTQTSSMPWDGIGTFIINGLSNNFTLALAAVAVFGAGLTLMFSEGGGFSQKALKIAFGIGIILGAANVGAKVAAAGCLF